MGNEVREIRIVLSGKRIILSGILAALLIFCAVAGALVFWKTSSVEKAAAYEPNGMGAKTWIFAEGYTGPGFDEWILIYNPLVPVGSGNNVKVRLILSSNTGLIGTYDTPDIAPNQRYSVNINSVCQSFGYSGDVSVTAVTQPYPPGGGGQNFVCERAMYYDYNGITGGSQTFGYNEAATGY